MENLKKGQKKINLSKVQGSVEQIHVEGLKRTKNDIFIKHIQPIFKAQSFEEILREAQIAKEKFEMLGLFKSSVITVDASKKNPDSSTSYDLFLKVREQRLLTGGLSTMVGTNEGTLVGSLNLQNVYGRGERMSADLLYGSKNAIGWSLSAIKPLYLEPHLLLKGSVFQLSGDFPWSSFKQIDRGIAIDYSFPSLLGDHVVRWEGVWRELCCLGEKCAFAIREEAGHNLKSSIKHTWSRDTRDNRVLPSFGYMLKIVHELAGIGGDAKFLKQDVEVQLNKELPFDSTLQFSLAGGLLTNPWPTRFSIMDRFFIGGPLTLRGFSFKGVGPRVEGCSLGGDVYWSSGIHLYTPLPFRPSHNGFCQHFRTHLFLNAGNLASYNSELSWRDNASRLVSDTRVSTGFGVVLRMGGVARLELNYCIPLKAQATDSISPGLQIGVGVNFL